MALLGVFLVIIFEIILATIFFHRPYSVWKANCSAAWILKRVAYYGITVMNIVVLNTIMTVSFILLVVLFLKRGQAAKKITNNTQSNSRIMMHKLTKATAITLGLYIMLQSPAIIMLFVWSFVYFGHTYTGEIVSDYIYIVLYINNVVNPVIYYFTLKDCREGYKKICLCTNPNRTDRCQQFADITIVN